ncbi:MAG: L-seryl-tRNA(Sec) selenium transferase [Spirochaetota bacterium]|nr:L-seryl-tRNA(Sec) selenium transferase [Spirochaetota bacterium]
MYEQIPQVQKLLEEDSIRQFIGEIGHPFVVAVIRETLEEERKNIAKGIPFDYGKCVEAIAHKCRAIRMEKLQRVINGTGILLHTNLGRAPLGKDILSSVTENLSAYCNVEFHIPSQKRGKRGGFAEKLICLITGAEDALIVNNNAASVFLILHHFARNKEVIISRGELIQIGGGFRIPDIMKQAGCHLVEVGTTNITDVSDYKNAMTENTALILSAHRSNFYMRGFTQSPTLQQLATLKSDRVFLVKDLGSGNLIFNNDDNVAQALNYADLVCFSGDKLLGACQAGIIAGKKDLIATLKKDPLMRIVRVDKVTYFILQQVLLHYANNRHGVIPTWSFMKQDLHAIDKKIKKLSKKLKHEVKPYVQRINSKTAFGGGAMPDKVLPDYGIAIAIDGKKASDIATHMVSQPVPIIGYIQNDVFTINFRTILDDDIGNVADAINSLQP